MGNTTKPVVLEKKGNQYSIQPSKLPQPVSSEGTITVVAATTPTLSPAGSGTNYEFYYHVVLVSQYSTALYFKVKFLKYFNNFFWLQPHKMLITVDMM